MVNFEDFIKRLEAVLDYYSLNAATFADKIGVQRSSLSHLLSGRNKPSLDFVLKIIEEFPDIDLYWILLGKGNFPKQENRNEVKDDILPYPNILFKKKVATTFENKNDKKITAPQFEGIKEQLQQIIFVYTDGSFKVLYPKQE